MLDSVRRLTLDTDASYAEVEDCHGTVHRQRVPEPTGCELRLPPDFRSVTYVPGDQTLTLTCPSGDILTIEVSDGISQADRRAGRPAIYLDQNKWVVLAQAIYSPDRVHQKELPAALRLIQLARDERVILPLSAGHLVETGRTDRAWRAHLAPLMIQLSRGWFMRDPILVRRTELGLILAADATSSPAAVPDVITLDPSQLSDWFVLSPEAADLPAELIDLQATLSLVTSLYALLIENEATHSVAGYEAAAEWAASHHRLAVELGTNSKARHLSRDLTRSLFLTDLGMDLPQAVCLSGMSPSAFKVWLEDEAETDLVAAPFLGRMRDVIHLRLRNSEDNWEPNDLIDMLFLPCAAAYADFLVCERKTGDLLRRGERHRNDGAQIVSSLVDLTDLLDGDARLDSGRSA